MHAVGTVCGVSMHVAMLWQSMPLQPCVVFRVLPTVSQGSRQHRRQDRPWQGLEGQEDARAPGRRDQDVQEHLAVQGGRLWRHTMCLALLAVACPLRGLLSWHDPCSNDTCACAMQLLLYMLYMLGLQTNVLTYGLSSVFLQTVPSYNHECTCYVLQVDPERNLLFVRGQVPGPQGSFVLVRDAFRWKWMQRQAAELPFPTHIRELPPVSVAKRDGGDPYRVSPWAALGLTGESIRLDGVCCHLNELLKERIYAVMCGPVARQLSISKACFCSFVMLTYVLRLSCRCTGRTSATSRPTGRVTRCATLLGWVQCVPLLTQHTGPPQGYAVCHCHCQSTLSLLLSVQCVIVIVNFSAGELWYLAHCRVPFVQACMLVQAGGLGLQASGSHVLCVCTLWRAAQVCCCKVLQASASQCVQGGSGIPVGPCTGGLEGAPFAAVALQPLVTTMGVRFILKLKAMHISQFYFTGLQPQCLPTSCMVPRNGAVRCLMLPESAGCNAQHKLRSNNLQDECEGPPSLFKQKAHTCLLCSSCADASHTGPMLLSDLDHMT
jgi:hypothetical protein